MCQFIPNYITKHILKNAPINIKNNFTASLLSHKNKVVNNIVGIKNTKQSNSINRSIFNAENEYALPGTLARKENDPKVNNKEVDDAYDFSGLTYSFFKQTFNRNSIDDKGMELISTVKYGEKYPNAYYNGRQIVLGDGDGEIFNSFVLLDIIAHEWSHGTTNHTADLDYFSQSGALNESFSDIFGVCVRHKLLNQEAKKASWVIGEGIFTPEIKGKGIRDMKNPGTAFDDVLIGKDRQPSTMKDYYYGDDDNQGVHINSSIPNKIFANFAINIGGYSFDKSAKIWYEVLTTKLNSSSNFQDMVNGLQDIVIENYGVGIELKALREACRSVGLFPRPTIFKQIGF